MNNKKSINKKGGVKWITLSHNGVLFPTDYIQKFVPIIYNGEKIILDSHIEEIMFLYAKYIGTEYTKNSTFNKNFWKDLKKIIGKNHFIKSLDECDFSLFIKHIEEYKEKIKNMPKDEKERLKKIQDENEEKYKVAILDGKVQKVGNYKIEPPGIFIGRGKNPNLGKIKKRITQNDVIINIGKNEPIPLLKTGEKWKKIIHDKNVEWLATWKDTITGKSKYVWLASNSNFKSESDIKKFDLARKLKKKIKKIHKENDINLQSTDLKLKQIATAMFFIDKLALRVGNEKTKDEADTVGVSSLKIKNIILGENNKLTLDFLGKDSIRYQNTINIDNIIYDNITEFSRNKGKDEELFHLITSNDINKYLQQFMKDLTAKVFRTFNASKLFEKELRKIENKYLENENDININIILDEFKKANIKVAKVMNHQKNVSKGYKDQLEKIVKYIKKLQSQLRKAKAMKNKNKERIKKLQDKIEAYKIKKDLKKDLKNISLETSKANYIDPRIVFSFIKKFNISDNKVYSSILIDKFSWAKKEENFIF